MWREALQLQYARCEVYKQWNTLFRQVLDGSLTADDFGSLLTQTIVVRFQDISAAVRAIRDNVSDAPDAVRKWSTELQLLEKHKYDTTVEYQALVLAHLSHAKVGDSNKGTQCTTTEPEVRRHCRDCPLAALAPSFAVEGRLLHQISFCLEIMDAHNDEDYDGIDNGSFGADEDDGGDAPWLETEQVAWVRSCQQFNAKLAHLRRKMQEQQTEIASLMDEAQEELTNEAPSS